MSYSIPASQLVAVTPGVLAAGGTGLSLNGLLLTNSTRVPTGTVASFPTPEAVGQFFGDSSEEAAAASIYFGGFDNSNVKPGALLFSQYPDADVPAYLRGGSVASLTLTQLQALGTGTVIVSINGHAHTSGSIALGGATSFSNAAALIEAGLAAYDAVVTGSIGTTTLTVTAVASGEVYPGQVISGSGVTVGTKVVAQLTGPVGGIGTYSVDTSQTAGSTTISAGPAAVAYDSQSGAFTITGGTPGAVSTIGFATGTLSTGLKLTAATGASTSQGAAEADPATAMEAISQTTQDWASFSSIFEPVTADKVLFAEWNNGKNNRYLYAMADTDAAPTTSNDTTSAGHQITAAGYSGTCCIYEPEYGTLGPFVMGWAASIDFTQTNGRATLAFKGQSGLEAGVTDSTIAANLIANNYNFYGAYATAAQRFVMFQTGSVSGDFLWADSYVDQVWLNNALQLALMILLTQVRSIPYNSTGYSLIDAACMDTITEALNAGVIRPGVTLSSLQVAEVNASAGANIAPTLQTRGWYLQVKDANPTVRVARGSPPITFWYMDGQSIQKINLASIEVQ